MILFSFLCILLISFISASDDCRGHFSYENACNKITLELITEWLMNKPIPSVKVASSLAVDCQRAQGCVKTIECSEKDREISKKIADLGEMCSGISAFGSSFGKCIPVIQSKESSREYPCLKYWDNVNQTPTCEFFESDYDCAQMIVENQCGTRALDEMNKNKNFIADFFGCTLSGSTNRTLSKSDSSEEIDGFLRG